MYFFCLLSFSHTINCVLPRNGQKETVFRPTLDKRKLPFHSMLSCNAHREPVKRRVNQDKSCFMRQSSVGSDKTFPSLFKRLNFCALAQHLPPWSALSSATTICQSRFRWLVGHLWCAALQRQGEVEQEDRKPRRRPTLTRITCWSI